jgi:hypothetical protein
MGSMFGMQSKDAARLLLLLPPLSAEQQSADTCFCGALGACIAPPLNGLHLPAVPALVLWRLLIRHMQGASRVLQLQLLASVLRQLHTCYACVTLVVMVMWTNPSW